MVGYKTVVIFLWVILYMVNNIQSQHCEKLYLQDCTEVVGQDKIALINPSGEKWHPVRCEHGWTVIQDRFDGKLSFDAKWDQYVNGFGLAGNLCSEHWIGLELIHQLTKNKPRMLKIILEDADGLEGKAIYKKFSVGPAYTNYKLSVQEFLSSISTVGDALKFDNGAEFSTYDRDHDQDGRWNCALHHGGGWWHESTCSNSNLNGEYGVAASDQAMFWLQWHDSWKGMTRTRIMIK